MGGVAIKVGKPVHLIRRGVVARVAVRHALGFTCRPVKAFETALHLMLASVLTPFLPLSRYLRAPDPTVRSCVLAAPINHIFEPPVYRARLHSIVRSGRLAFRRDGDDQWVIRR